MIGISSAKPDIGYGTGNGSREAVTRIFEDLTAASNGCDLLIADWIETPIGAMLAVADASALHVPSSLTAERACGRRHIPRLHSAACRPALARWAVRTEQTRSSSAFRAIASSEWTARSLDTEEAMAKAVAAPT